MQFMCFQASRSNLIFQCGFHSKFIIQESFISRCRPSRLLRRKPSVSTQVDTVKDTIVTGYTEELKNQSAIVFATR